ncbi:unnamed protein product, partial [Lymnaea stagnalis]
ELENGYIASPGYPLQYPANSYFSWTIRGRLESFISFSISDMDIENSPNCTYDSLKIYDGITGMQLATFCNRSQTTINVVASTTHSMLIVFKTNGNVEGKGFSGAYRILDYNSTITEPRAGYIASPGYPLQYPSNSYFSWTIRGRPGSFISLRLRNLTLEPHENCSFKYVQVYDGNNSDARILTQMCPNKDDQRVFTSTGSSLYIAFRSASSIDKSGFLASYEINDFGDRSLCDPQVKRMCGSDLYFECRPDKQGDFRCLCTSGMYSDGTFCTSDFQLSVVLNSQPQILTKDVTFNWTSRTLNQQVAYTITWVATNDSSDSEG